MKKVFLVVGFLIVCLSGLNAQHNEKSIGLKLNHGSDIKSFGLGAAFSYSITDEIRISPGLNYYFKHNNRSLFTFDVDGNYLFWINKEFAAYPLAGITFQNWKLDYLDNNKNKSRLGINIGGGAHYDFDVDWRVFAELKYSIVNDWDQLVFSIGVAFVFN